MLLTEITANDRHKLDWVRIDRLLSFFPSSLPCCQIQIDPSQILIIHCPNVAIADNLLEDLADLRYRAWLVLGIRSIVIYLADEEILRTDIYK
jgi:hypothetical protein